MWDITKRAFASVALAIPSVIVGIVVRKALEAWGILDPFSEWLGGWLKVNISPEQAEWTTAAVIAVGGYGISLWFVWRQSRAPLWDKSDGKALAGGLRNVMDSLTKPIPEPPAPLPDMPIHDLFFHIRPDLLENAAEKRWEAVARDVMDKFSTAQLNVWGREIDPNLNIAGALVQIPSNYWHKRTFIFHFLYEDKGVGQLVGKEMAHTYSWQDPKALQYADLQVSRMQALRIWPQRFKEALAHGKRRQDRLVKFASIGTLLVIVAIGTGAFVWQQIAGKPSSLPMPTCTLSVVPAVIQRAQDFALTWASTNATGGSISDIGQLAELNGHVTVTGQTQSETFNGTFAGDGGTANCQTTITVAERLPPSPPTPTCALRVSPTMIPKNGTARLDWESKFAVSGYLEGVASFPETSGHWLLDNLYQTTRYHAVFYGPGGSGECFVTVRVK